MAKVLILVVRRYNKNEFWPLLRTLLDRGHEFDIASTSHNIMDEKYFEPNTIEHLIEDIKSFDGYDAIVLVSGNPQDTEAFWHDERILSLVQQAREQDAVIGAICAAVPAIRKVSKGIEVSAFPLRKAVELLEDEGVIISSRSLTTDKRTVTGENEVTTLMWAENICDLLEGKKPSNVLHESAFKRKLGERRPMPEVVRIQKIIERTGKDEV